MIIIIIKEMGFLSSKIRKNRMGIAKIEIMKIKRLN